jgi:hypothetical protein
MDPTLKLTQSAFFVLNVWEEHRGGGHLEWRGEMLHVDSGTTLRFEDWPELVDLIANALHTLRPDDKRQGAVGLTPTIG